MATVIVAFLVDAPTGEAEDIVADRLDRARLLWQNDSNDIVGGTLDPINTYAVLPVTQILDDSL